MKHKSFFSVPFDARWRFNTLYKSLLCTFPTLGLLVQILSTLMLGLLKVVSKELPTQLKCFIVST